MDIYTNVTERFAQFVLDPVRNCVTAADAICPEMEGLVLWDAPLMAVANAADPLFAALQNDAVVDAQYPLPTWWLPGAKRVLSFFLPCAPQVEQSNRTDRRRSSPEWLHARIEGQERLLEAGEFLCQLLRQAGYEAVMPATDPRFRLFHPYASNWSERHTAYICGLGTFGASKGIITQKGMAGRLGSVITTCGDLPVTPRPYHDVYEYCIQCRACERRCPVQAIDLSRGLDRAKDHTLCGPYISASATPPQGRSQKVRYGCGKCQVGVPCAIKNPCRPIRRQG
ncbi:4Fe-4S binding protein [uncultured Megasphaera sp.]|uniref:4Fe-4S binding protein n=1 Tax=uncultured Megasphaera sp. TaxID=165188 RepID=UPI0026599EE1|nr:4Fe-4S binding protein [uncultured Megasphaera sp.]